jgi:hypothetical protein
LASARPRRRSRVRTISANGGWPAGPPSEPATLQDPILVPDESVKQ